MTLAACSYDFSNPAEELYPGQVAGRVVADTSGTGSFAPMTGVSVALENSPYDQVTRETGRFTLLGMPAGRHTMLFRKGTTWAQQRDVEVGYGPNGQPEAVVIGDVRLRYTVTLLGKLSVPAGLSVDPATAIVEDEATGARAALASGAAPGEIAYAFQGLAVGAHKVRFAVSGALSDPILGSIPASYVGGPLALTVPDSSEGQSLTLNPVTLHPTGTGTGRVQFKLAVVASEPTSASGSTVTITPTPPGGDPVPDSTGFVDVDLPEGVYTLDVFPPQPPTGGQPTFLLPPPRQTFVVGADQVTDLGVLYAVDDAVAFGTSKACFDDADCAPGACVGGFCEGWTPPPAAPPSVPFCQPDVARACSASVCVPCADGYGTCASGASGLVCVPLGAKECTPDGFEVVFNSCLG
jgi:hypothetical protein